MIGISVDLFKKLDLEEKREYLSKMLTPIVKEYEEIRYYIDLFLYWTTDTQLTDFYIAITNPDNIGDYIDTIWLQIKKWNNEIMHIQSLYNQEKLKMYESLDNVEDIDKIIQNI